MSIEAPRYKLYSALKSLRASWEQARERWQDAVRQEFERWHDARVKQFVPVFVERNVRQRLRFSERPAAAR